MYNIQAVSERIKNDARKQGIKLKDLLEDCELNVNFISQMSDRTGAFALAKIADRLDCSVDYLLGRTDNPNLTTDTYSGDNNGVQAINNGNHSSLTVNGNSKTDTEELVELIQNLPLIKRAEAILYLNELKTKK